MQHIAKRRELDQENFGRLICPSYCGQGIFLLTRHTRIIVLFANQLSGLFTTIGKLELRRLIPRQASSVFGIE
jgi:hypothetical protein